MLAMAALIGAAIGAMAVLLRRLRGVADWVAGPLLGVVGALLGALAVAMLLDRPPGGGPATEPLLAATAGAIVVLLVWLVIGRLGGRPRTVRRGEVISYPTHQPPPEEPAEDRPADPPTAGGAAGR